MERLVIDSETTGLSRNQHQLLTLGMLLVDVSKDHLEVIDSRHLFVRHDEYNVDRFATAVHGINIAEHNKIGIDTNQACRAVEHFIDEHSLRITPILGHNVHFDVGFLTTLFEEEGRSYPIHTEKDDTMYMWRRLKKQGAVKSFGDSKLGTIARYFDIDYTKAHDALADCEITAKVFHRLLGIKSV
ncbi:MAG: DNA polymerase III epsilon subunit-like protein [Patescibacteria group bacterium]|jgi:DNA polymerase III epsilon subunit-like protein